MTLPDVKYDVPNVRDTTRIVRAVHVGQALHQRYPNAAPVAICALSWAYPFALHWRRWVAAHVAVVALGAALWYAPNVWAWLRSRRHTQPEPVRAAVDWPELWFREVCKFAQIKPIPLVLKHYPTAKGHAFYVLVTHDIGLEGRPMTVQSLIDMGALLKDAAGIGCTNCEPEADKQNGGRAIVYFNGVSFEGYEYQPPGPEPIRCVMVGCDKPAEQHVLVDDGDRWSIMCAGHLIAYADRVHDGHPVTDDCHEADCWHHDIDPTTELDIELPDADATDRKWGAPIGPAMDPHLREAVAGEGSEAPYPPGVEPASTRGRILDIVRAAQGPLRRGTIANLAELSPTTVEDHLAALKDAGAVEKVASLWVASAEYRTSGMFPGHGAEEDHSG